MIPAAHRTVVYVEGKAVFIGSLTGTIITNKMKESHLDTTTRIYATDWVLIGQSPVCGTSRPPWKSVHLRVSRALKLFKMSGSLFCVLKGSIMLVLG